MCEGRAKWGGRGSASVPTAALAAAADRDFAPFARPILEFCRKAMQLTDPRMLLIRARATECVGIVATSLGAEFMKPFTPTLVDLALEGLKLKKAHELSEYTISFFSNVCIMLERDFLPYCQRIVPFINHICLSADDENRVYLGDFAQDKRPTTAPVVGYKQGIVRESYIDEKAMAVTALGLIAGRLGGAFLPWLEDSVNTLLSLKFHFHPDIRSAVFKSLAEIVSVVFQVYPADEQWVPGQLGSKYVNPACYTILTEIVPHLIVATMSDPSIPAVRAALKSIGTIANIVGPSAIKREFLEQIKVALGTLFSGRAACQKRTDIEERDTDQDFVQIYFDTTDLFMDLSIPFGAAYQPFFEDMLPLFLKKMGEDDSLPYREGAMGTIAETLRNMDNSAPYLAKLMPLITKATQQHLDKGEGLRRNAAYCIGVIAQTGDIAILPHLGKLAVLLKPLLSEKSSCSNNAAGSLARIILHGLHHKQTLPYPEMLKGILAAMPINSDYEPLSPICDAVIEILNSVQKDPTASPSKNILSLTPVIVSKLGPMLAQSAINRKRRKDRSAPLSENQESKILDDEIENQLGDLLRSMYRRYQTQLQPALDALPEDIRESLLAYLSSSV